MRLAIVTGGSRGLGASLCEQLDADGFRLTEFSRSAPHPYSVAVDLSDPLASRVQLDNVLAGIDTESVTELLVVHNAGTLDPIGPASRKAPAALVANLNTNLVSPIAILAGTVAKFQDNPCRKVVVCVSSGAALRAFSGWSLYDAAKAGMEHFIRTLALEQTAQPHPFIAVNFDPGVIDTEMQALIRSSTKVDFPDVERFVQRKEKGQLAPPAKVAASLVALLSRHDLVGGERYSAS
jgi:benzil reductase ((S)-benzoin forming)